MVDTEMETTEETDKKNPWGWYSTIYSLAGENILNVEKVVNINHIEVFNWITYTMVLNNKREQELRKSVKL